MEAEPALSVIFPVPRASVSLVALSLVTALGVAVGSYLALMAHGQQMGVRELQNERTRELLQAGLEEALWSLNEGNWTGSGPGNDTAWTTSGADRTVTLNYGLLGNGASGEVNLTVNNYASAGPAWPTITVRATVTLTDGRMVTKNLQAVTGPAALFGNAIASAEAGVLFGAGGTVDSWNSDPDNNPATAAVAYSFTAGNPANYAAVVAGKDDGTQGVALTQTAVNGYVATFGKPVTYSISGAPPAKILGPATAAGVNVDTMRLGRSAFIPTTSVFTVSPPPTSGPAYGGLLGDILGLVAALLSAPPAVEVYKINGDLNIAGIPLLAPNLTVSRPLKLIVDGNVTISGAGKITITSTGSLQLFIAGDCTIGGNGVDNQNVEAAKCAIFCTSASPADTLQYTAGADFRGVIYCENKPIDIRQNATFFGALLSRQQISFTTGATAPVFHYDTALRVTRFQNIRTPYVITQLSQP